MAIRTEYVCVHNNKTHSVRFNVNSPNNICHSVCSNTSSRIFGDYGYGIYCVAPAV